MPDTNYVGVIVKIVESPSKKTFQKDISFVEFRAHLPQVRNNRVIQLNFWGNLAQDVVNYYKVNDYILVEGYLSLRPAESNSAGNQILKNPEITVLKIYPFLFSQS